MNNTIENTIENTIKEGTEKLVRINNLDSIMELIVENRFSANYTTHEHSKAEASDSYPCSDLEIYNFFKEMETEDIVSLRVSAIDWEVNGNCVGDELYDCILTTTKIPTRVGSMQKYIVELNTIKGVETFLYISHFEVK